jgi:hypothetical protein
MGIRQSDTPSTQLRTNAGRIIQDDGTADPPRFAPESAARPGNEKVDKKVLDFLGDIPNPPKVNARLTFG